MSLGSWVSDKKEQIRRAILLKRLMSNLKEAQLKGTLGVVLYGLVSAILTAVVAHVTAACPGITTQWGAIIIAGFGAGVTFLSNRPQKNVGLIATLLGIGGAGLSAMIDQVRTICGADFIHQLPTLLTVSVFIGIGVHLNPPKKA